MAGYRQRGRGDNKSKLVCNDGTPLKRGQHPTNVPYDPGWITKIRWFTFSDAIKRKHRPLRKQFPEWLYKVVVLDNIHSYLNRKFPHGNILRWAGRWNIFSLEKSGSARWTTMIPCRRVKWGTSWGSFSLKITICIFSMFQLNWWASRFHFKPRNLEMMYSTRSWLNAARHRWLTVFDASPDLKWF